MRIRLIDRWWYFNYRWHRWRLERTGRAMAIHATILYDHFGQKPDDLQIKVKIL